MHQGHRQMIHLALLNLTHSKKTKPEETFGSLQCIGKDPEKKSLYWKFGGFRGGIVQ
jgi:hypothetical protein